MSNFLSPMTLTIALLLMLLPPPRRRRPGPACSIRRDEGIRLRGERSCRDLSLSRPWSRLIARPPRENRSLKSSNEHLCKHRKSRPISCFASVLPNAPVILQYNAAPWRCQNREKVVKQWEAPRRPHLTSHPFIYEYAAVFRGRPAMHYYAAGAAAAAAAAEVVSCCAIMI